MRIMQLAAVLGSIGGTEIFVQRLSEQFGRQGHDTLVVTSSSPSQPRPYEIRQVDAYLAPGSAGEEQVLRVLDEYRPDVVLSHTTPNGSLLSALNVRCPTVEFVHVFLCAGGKLFRRKDRLCTHPLGMRCLLDWYIGPCGPAKSPQVALESHRRTLQHRDALRQLPAVLVLTDFMRDYLIKEGVSAERIQVVEANLGIPAEYTKAVPRKTARTGTSVLFVGRVVYNKGVQHAIKALTYLDRSYRLTVVGDGFYLSDLKALASHLNVEDRVTFKGFLQGEMLEAQYQEADVVVVPSLWPEPAGLVVPEARARGLPVAAFDVGGIREWSTRYGYSNVHLAAPASAQSLARALMDAARGDVPAPSSVATPPPQIVQVLKRVLIAEAMPVRL